MTDSPPLVLARDLQDVEYLGGIVVHETTSVRIHLTFTDLQPLRDVADFILAANGLTDEERVFVAVPGSWSLYVSPAALVALDASGHYRVEGR